MKKEIRKSRKKLWVLSEAVHTEGMDQGHENAYSRILATWAGPTICARPDSAGP